MMPMGYEYGCRKPLDVVGSRPGDWAWETAAPRIDLTGFVGAVNRMKAATPALNVEGPQSKVTAPHNPVVGLLRLSGGDVASSEDAAIVLINPDPARLHGIDPGPLINQAGGRIGRFEDVTPDGPALPFEPGRPISMEPLRLRVFRGHAAALQSVARRGKAAGAADEKRLFELARNRVVIERVEPELDGGRHAIKRVAGDVVEVEADIFCDGHDKIAACIRYRAQDEADWREAPMAFVDNDRWGGRFPVHRNCRYFYTIEAWRDLFESWRAEVMKKHDAGLDVGLELIEGRALLERTEEQANGADRQALQALLEELAAQPGDQGALMHRMLSEDVRTLMSRAGIRTNASRYAARARGVRRPADRQVRRVVRDVPALAERRSQPPRHVRRRDRAPALCPGHGFRCAVLHADPPDRPGQPQGPQQHADPGAGRPGQPVCHRQRGRRPRRAPSRARHLRRLPPAGRRRACARSRDRARLRDPMLAGPSVDQGAPRVVRLAPGRHDQIRREPAQEVRGHRQRPLLPGSAAVDLVRAARRRAVLDRPRREDLPGRQPAHQAGAVLGMADPRCAGPSPRRDLPVGGVHPAEDDEAAGQGRLHPELFLFHLAQHQAGADRVSDRADPGRAEGIHAAELLRQYA